MKSSTLKNRGVALFVVFSFLIQSVLPFTDAYAAFTSPTPLGVLESKEETQPNGGSLPTRLGEIKETFDGTIGRTVIHVQDAHCNYSCQHSIAGIIDHFKKTRNIDLIGLEGGVGDYDLSVFTDIGDPDIRTWVADYFVKEGEVNGAELYFVNNPGSVKLWGVEDLDLYRENLNAYRDSLKYKEDVDKALNSLSHITRNMKPKVYSLKLMAQDEKAGDFKGGKMNFKDYVLSLAVSAKDLKLDLARYPTLAQLYGIMEDEKRIDFKQANKERNTLIDRLNKKLSKKGIEELVGKSLAFKTGDITQEEYYSYLFKKAEFCGADLEKLPNLTRYSDYVKRYERLDKASLMKEVKALEDGIFMSMMTTDDQRALYELDRRLSIIKGIFSISLIKEEWDHYIQNKDGFAADNFITFFNSKCPVYGLNLKLDSGIARLDKYREDMEKFYAYSLKRDDAFLNNIESMMTRDNKTTILLVTGGFHTGNLKELFRAKGYSYIEVMPRLVKQDDCPYFRLLAGGVDPLTKAIMESQAAIAVPDPSNPAVAKATGAEKISAAMRLTAELLTALMSGNTEGVELPSGVTLAGGRLEFSDGTYMPFDILRASSAGKAAAATKDALERSRDQLEEALKAAKWIDTNGREFAGFADNWTSGDGWFRDSDLSKFTADIVDYSTAHIRRGALGSNPAYDVWGKSSTKGDVVKIVLEYTESYYNGVTTTLATAEIRFNGEEFKQGDRVLAIASPMEAGEPIGLDILSKLLKDGWKGQPMNPARVAEDNGIDWKDMIAELISADHVNIEVMRPSGGVAVTYRFEGELNGGDLSLRYVYHNLAGDKTLGEARIAVNDALMAQLRASSAGKKDPRKTDETEADVLRGQYGTLEGDLTRLGGTPNTVQFFIDGRRIILGSQGLVYAEGNQVESIEVTIRNNDSCAMRLIELLNQWGGVKDGRIRVKASRERGGEGIEGGKELELKRVTYGRPSFNTFTLACNVRGGKSKNYTLEHYSHNITYIHATLEAKKHLDPFTFRARRVAAHDFIKLVPDNFGAGEIHAKVTFKAKTAEEARKAADIARKLAEAEEARRPSETERAEAARGAQEKYALEESLQRYEDAKRQVYQDMLNKPFANAMSVPGPDGGWIRFERDPNGRVVRASSAGIPADIAQPLKEVLGIPAEEWDGVEAGLTKQNLTITDELVIRAIAEWISDRGYIAQVLTSGAALQPIPFNMQLNAVKNLDRQEKDIGFPGREYLPNLKERLDKVFDQVISEQILRYLIIAYATSFSNQDGRWAAFHTWQFSDRDARPVTEVAARDIYEGMDPISIAQVVAGWSPDKYNIVDLERLLMRLSEERGQEFADTVRSYLQLDTESGIFGLKFEYIGPARASSAGMVLNVNVSGNAVNIGYGNLAPMAVRAGEIEADMDTATQSLSQAMRQYTPAIKEGMPGAIVMFLKPEQYAIAKQYTPSDRAAIEDKMVTYLPNEKIRIIIAEDTEANRARVKGELEGVVPPERVMAFVVAAPGEVDAQNEALKPWACPIVLIGKAQSGQVPFVRIDRCARSGFEGLNVQEIMARPNATEGDKLQAAQRFANSLGGVADGDLGEDLKKIVDAVIENKGLKDLLISIEIRPADINELPDIERGIKEILRAA